MNNSIAIVIPTLNPDFKIVELARRLRTLLPNPIIVVNDGSRPECLPVFGELETVADLKILTHCVNLGKGRGLKTAFNYYLNHFPNGLGVVTCDGDGQHLPSDIAACVNALSSSPASLILGCRVFSEPGVPWKSRFGNNLTRGVFRIVGGVQISDTQTGLRGIPAAFMRQLMNVFGERFEFETEMLLSARETGVALLEIPIATVYMDGNRETHFRPLVDSFKIYRTIFRGLVRRLVAFGLSGALSAVLDLWLFAIFFDLVFPGIEHARLLLSVVLARCISATFNYLLNRNVVFRDHGGGGVFSGGSFCKYVFLCVAIMLASYGLTRLGHYLSGSDKFVWIKAVADVVLFLVSYGVQRHWIFRKKGDHAA